VSEFSFAWTSILTVQTVPQNAATGNTAMGAAPGQGACHGMGAGAARTQLRLALERAAK